MNTKTEALLNEQIKMEQQSSADYLAMAVWAEVNCYPGAAHFLYEQSQEEREHMMRLVRFMTDLGKKIIIPSSEAVDPAYKSLKEVFANAMQNEMKVTQKINAMVNHALSCQDFATFEFLQWFIAEQREEESTARKANDLFALMGEATGVAGHQIDLALRALRKEAA